MTSILTNASAMTALKNLNLTNEKLSVTQGRISTGLRVAEAADNAAYWSIATQMRSDNKALSTVQDALGLGAAKIDVAYTGLNSAIEVVDEIKSKLVAAREAGVDRSKIQDEISELQTQLLSIASSSSFVGENWLSVDSSVAGFNATKSVVASFTRAADGSVSIGTISINTSTTILFDSAADAAGPAGVGIIDAYRDTTGAIIAGQNAPTATDFRLSDLDISTLTNSAADLTTLEGHISRADTALSEMTTAAGSLGAAKKSVSMQKEFVTNLMDAMDRGIGQLVDANMNTESTKLQALQVQQQLGIQALSIANSSWQTILSLFR
jgi:flagellin